MEARKLVGWNVRRLRVAKELTIEELADQAGADTSFVARLERGEVNVGIDMLQRLAGPLGVKLADLTTEPAAGAQPPQPLRSGRRPQRPQAAPLASTSESDVRAERPKGVALLRRVIAEVAAEAGKEHLVAGRGLDRLTERIARAITMGGEQIAEDVLLSEDFRRDVARALGVARSSSPSESRILVDKEKRGRRGHGGLQKR